MKKVCHVLSLLLCCVFLAGCGGQEKDTLWNKDTLGGKDTLSDTPLNGGAQQDGTIEYLDVEADINPIFCQDNRMGSVMNTQFYQGEAVQICATINKNDRTVNIYLYREEGGNELLLENLPEDYYFGEWFLDAEGNLYTWVNTGDGSIEKLDTSGKIRYSIPLKDIGTSRITDMCQLADGRVLITYLVGNVGSYYTLSEMDATTGKISQVSTVKLDGLGRVAAGEEGLLYMDAKGVYTIDMEEGSKTSILSFIGTSYLLKDERYIEDFRVRADGSVEILRHDRDQETGITTYISEVLQTGTETTEKVVLTMRCYGVSGVNYGTELWLKNQMALFNQQSDSLLVVLDEAKEGVEREDFARQTSIEITAGKGPDLIFGDVLGDYVYGAIQKGALVDLVPYMEASGIKEEDYFPAAFDCWKENGGIYGVGLTVSLRSYRIRQEVLGRDSVPDIETLVDALLGWQEEAVLMEYWDSQWVLEYLLEGSEDIWGMIDWEAGTCEFGGELFAKILETAKRYGYDERNNYPSVLEFRSTSLISFDTAANREAEGMAGAGVLFDDGCHAVITNSLPEYQNEMLAVNANSAHVEEAWELIRFLLGEEAQMAFEKDDTSINSTIPVNRKAYEICTEKRIAKWIAKEAKEYAYTMITDKGEIFQKYPRSYEDLTEEKIAEYMALLEGARPLPIRTAPLLDIIGEEAEYYFNGTKSIEEVSAVIRNRVQLYMDENN